MSAALNYGKNLKEVEEERESIEVDQISRLPDDILVCILSLLPTKYAVGTSTLAKRWKTLWTGVTNLDFDDDLVFQPPKSYKSKFLELRFTEFKKFVDQVLRDRNSPCVKKFRLRCTRPVYSHHLVTWITAAVELSSQELDINMDIRIIDYPFRPLRVPQCLFTCKTLVVLKIRSTVYFDYVTTPPVSFYLVNLKVLHIHMNRVDIKFIEKQFHSCPILEDFYVRRVQDLSTPLTLIASSTLKRLTTGTAWFVLRIVDAPSLEYLSLKHWSGAQFGPIVVNYLPALVEANFKLERVDNKLLRKISHAYRLTLHGCDLCCYNGNDLPVFPHLYYLEFSRYKFADVLRFLRLCPAVETLVLKLVDFSKAQYDFKGGSSCWLFNKLKEITFEGLKGIGNGTKLVTYMLENAKHLNKMTIKFDPCTPTASRDKLSNLLEAWDSCQIFIC